MYKSSHPGPAWTELLVGLILIGIAAVLILLQLLGLVSMGFMLFGLAVVAVAVTGAIHGLVNSLRQRKQTKGDLT